MSERSMHKIDQTAQAVAPRRELVRRLLEQKEPITHEEISAYVDGVMENIQRFDDPQAKAVFLMQDLQADLVLQDAATMPMYKGKIRAIMNFFREIVDNSEEPTKRTVLDKALEGKPGKEPRLTREDMEAVLQPIRRAVIEELKKRL
ncbi:hypothetical protein EXS71_02250, partial [Candidatus Uhrbacteria bacterium]|nr:hypothetical protein [Candidatus Uhrbacteria bacterium]